MQRLIRSPEHSGTQILAVGMVLLLLSTAVGTAAAAPRLFVSGGSLEDRTTLVGDDFDVNVTVKNTGSDGGALNVGIQRNGSKIAEHRVVVPSDETRRFTETVQFDEPGKYVIDAGNRELGTVRVLPAAASVVNNTATHRTVEARAGSVPTTEPYTFSFPESNHSVAVESWTVEANQEQFTQRVTTYDEPLASEAQLPSKAANVVGVVTVGSTGGIDAATMRVVVSRDGLRSAGLDQSAVGIYHQNGSTWEPLETTIVDQRTDSVVYEARATDFSTFAVGHIEPSYEIVDTSFESLDSEAGQRIVLDGVVRNDGGVAGEYNATMYVNDGAVNATTVRIPADDQRSVTLTHDVTEAGTYEIRLNGEDAGSLVISSSQVATETVTATPASGEQTETGGTDSVESATATPAQNVEDPNGVLPAGVPPTVAGIDTRYLAGGVGVALVVFFGVVLLLRRGNGGSGGNTGGFDQL
ncbi:PGF-pre-PGF domain-containing protein [Haloarcula marina]|uniref:PGF-pre-PGF domain-containing protein n=1 Tax=Haloarcula marina TaxID=2961574 RepID=UPI0020B75D92|nr:PGF-pre-PGF domain-containing protein [Halomicroarcula marina]